MSTINGTDLADILNGTTLDDIIKGLAGNDRLIGDAGNDRLDVGLDADVMRGGAGNDTYVVDNIGDKIFETTTTTSTVDAGGIDNVLSSISYSIASNLAGRQYVENLTLTGSAAINATGNDLANKLVGNGAANTLKGGLGNDRLEGLGGNDTLIGDAGSDRLDGGLGGDAMRGGAGNDTYIVDNAGDTVFETTTTTGTLDAGGVDNVLSSISYSIAGSIAGRQYIENLTLTGSAATNATGNDLANKLTGNGVANTLSGGIGNDTLSGGGGADILTGDKDMDRATGGLGNDVFKFASALDTWAWSDFSARGRANADSIADFTTGDKIDLSGVDAISSPSGHNQSGDQKFVFIGTGNFHEHTGRELRYEVYNGDTYIYGSINGDTTADFSIKLDGTHTLSYSDFIL